MGNAENKLPPRPSGTPPQKGGEGNPPLLVEEGLRGGDFKKFISFVIIIIFFLVGFFLINYSSNKNLAPENIKYVKIAEQNIKVELALTGAEQEKGLSARTTFALNTGMLFVFAKSGQYPFWMKDMNFPIDIIWLNENLKIVYIKKDARPELYPEIYQPLQNSGEAKYVLEVNSGFSDKNNLKVGGSVEFQ